MAAGVAGRFRQSLSKALSLSSDDEGDASNTLLGKSVNFLAKLSSSHGTQPEMRHKTLLVIDPGEHDWSKVFKGRKLHNGAFEIRLEQGSFSELDVVSSSERGTTVSMKVIRNSTVVARSFRPDYVLVREQVRGPDSKIDWTGALFGLMHGLVPSINTLSSTYSFLEKPVVFAELLKIQQRLGKENFPLVEQNFYQSYREMLLPPSLPVVVKVGTANCGYGKVCVASPRGFHDVASLVAMTGTYATSEPFLDSKFDIRIHKIGQRYKVYKRRSLSEAWKTNTGASIVEEIALTERYKQWADECSMLFGGLDILCVEAIHTKDDKEYILDVNNAPTSICSDKKDEDMKCIANLVIRKMEQMFPPPIEEDKTHYANGMSDAMQLLDTRSPILSRPLHHMQLTPEQVRPGSAPPPELSRTPKQATNGSGSTMSLGTEAGRKVSRERSAERSAHVTKDSLTGKMFGSTERQVP